MMMVISRDFEVVKAMFIFYFETIKEVFEVGEKLYKKEKNYLLENIENTPNIRTHFECVESLLKTDFESLSISDINEKVSLFCDEKNNEYEATTYEISNKLNSLTNYTMLIGFFKCFIPFINNIKNEFSKIVNVNNSNNFFVEWVTLKHTTYNVVFKFMESMENETNAYFLEQAISINELSKDISQLELRIHEISKLLKDKHNAYTKKHANFEKDILIYKTELKNTYFDRNKHKTTLFNFLSLLKNTVTKERNDLESIDIVFNEYFNSVVSVLDLLLKKTLGIYFDFQSIPLTYLDKIIQFCKF